MFVPAVAVGAAGVPVNVGEANGALAAKEFVTVVEKAASSPSAAASSSSVFNAPGAEATKLFIAVVISLGVALLFKVVCKSVMAEIGCVWAVGVLASVKRASLVPTLPSKAVCNPLMSATL